MFLSLFEEIYISKYATAVQEKDSICVTSNEYKDHFLGIERVCQIASLLDLSILISYDEKLKVIIR